MLDNISPFLFAKFRLFCFQNNVKISLNYISSKTLSTVLGISKNHFQTRSTDWRDYWSLFEFNNFAAHSQILCWKAVNFGRHFLNNCRNSHQNVDQQLNKSIILGDEPEVHATAPAPARCRGRGGATHRAARRAARRSRPPRGQPLRGKWPR